ncbi:MAG: extracellular solute-binding protein [Lachnospiraceae bacterium]|nr:extracellular solute-binding protein [Lachnospiraceae bacterium]
MYADDAGGSGDNTLTVWTWDLNFNVYAIEKAAEIYAQDHEGFKVEVTEVLSDDIETNLTTAASAGDYSTLPDIFLMQDNSFQKYVTNYPDIFTDLTDSGVDFSQFAEAKVAYSVVDGKNYGVPFDNGAVIAAYRMDYLEQAGFTIDDFTDITWSDFMEKAKVVKEKTGQPILTSQAGSPDLIMEMLQSCGASLFNEDGTLVEVTDWDQYVASLNNGTVASSINGCWIMASITAQEDQSGKWAITNMPRLERQENATNYSNNGGSSWAISSNCDNPELAMDFLNATFAGSTELYDDLLTAGTGAIATWSPAKESDVYAEPSEFFGGDAVNSKILGFSEQTPSNVTGPFYYDAHNAVGTALSAITQQGADMDSEIEKAQDTVEFNMGG